MRVFAEHVGDGLVNITRMLYAGVIDTLGDERAARAFFGPMVIALMVAVFLYIMARVLVGTIYYFNLLLSGASDAVRRLLYAVALCVALALVYRQVWGASDLMSLSARAVSLYHTLNGAVHNLSGDAVADEAAAPPATLESPPPYAEAARVAQWWWRQ